MFPIALNIAAELLEKVAASRHASDAVQNSQRAAGQHRSAGVFGSAVEKQSHSRQADIHARAASAHYSNRADFSERSREHAGQMLRTKA